MGYNFVVHIIGLSSFV